MLTREFLGARHCTALKSHAVEYCMHGASATGLKSTLNRLAASEIDFGKKNKNYKLYG